MPTAIARSTFAMNHPPSVLASAAVAGKKEGEGPMAQWFDEIQNDTTFGEKTWEKAESRFQQRACQLALKKAKMQPEQVKLLLAGDLLNQCISSSYGVKELMIPFFGLYGACSTMTEALSLAALLGDNGVIDPILAVTSSHFCSAERQFRYPLEYGGQRPPTAQWTATASGAALVGKGCKPPYLKAVTVGTIQDLGVHDINNMGAAMAPAAAATLLTYFQDTGTQPHQYDGIFTGDLGQVGTKLLYQLLARQQISVTPMHRDCGCLIFDLKSQDVHAGGSGCGCAASIGCGYLMRQLELGKLHNVLFLATGALMSTVSCQQGCSIPCISHLVYLSTDPTPVFQGGGR